MDMTLIRFFILLGISWVVPLAVAHMISKPVANKLHIYQEKAGQIASSFEPRAFQPSPFFSNCHLQTIGGAFWRDIPECSYVVDIGPTLLALGKWALRSRNPSLKHSYWDRRERISTPDGDWFHVDHKKFRGKSKGLMILIHGLEASSESSLSIDMAKAYSDIGLDVVCINFRSCSGEPNDTLRFYHLGFTDDLLLYLDLVKDDNRPIYVSGFSLGANVLLKALGELKERAVDDYNIKGAAVFCAPMNDVGYKSMLLPGINREIYAQTLLQSMQEKARVKLYQCCDGDPDTDKFDYRGCMAAKTIFDFENAYIAPVFGFADTIDYYKKTSCINFLHDVVVPTLILNGEDDPFFIEGKSNPAELAYENGGRAPLKIVESKNGGHCGFIFHQLDPEEQRVPSTSWGPTEMARFVNHVISAVDAETADGLQLG